MAITTYTELKAAIANWLDRDDLTAVIPDFISLAEKQMEREIRHYKMIERSSGALDSQYSAVPADWLETLRFSIIDGNTSALEMTTLNDLMTRRENASNTNGRPRFYAHIGETFELFPTPDTTYNMELVYYQEIPALSASNATNWLLTDAPDAYLYGALSQASPYLGEDERVAVWNSLFAGAVASLNRASLKTSQSSSGMRIQVNTY
jgi:hypothetical protein